MQDERWGRGRGIENRTLWDAQSQYGQSSMIWWQTGKWIWNGWWNCTNTSRNKSRRDIGVRQQGKPQEWSKEDYYSEWKCKVFCSRQKQQ